MNSIRRAMLRRRAILGEHDEARDAHGAGWVDSLAGDVRFAVRYFGRRKATTALIIVVLALGTGANATIFTTFQAQFLRPAPAMPDNVAHVRVWARERSTKSAAWQPRLWTQPEVATLAARREIFSGVAAWSEDEIVLDGGDGSGARGVSAQFVTPNYFGVAGVNLFTGRGFRESDGDGPDMSAIIAYAMAEQLFGNAGAAVDRQIMVNEVPVHVIGVAAPRFQGALRNMHEPALWIPLSARATIARISPRWLIDEPGLAIFARLAPDASRAQAAALARQVVVAALPDSAARVGMSRTADVIGINAPPPGSDASQVYFAFAVMLTIGFLILLVAWTNVSSLMVAAAVGRRHEIAVRLSLGASRMRLLRQLVTESTMLAVAGSALGLIAAWWLITWKGKTEVHDVDIAPDLGTFAFVLVMALVTGIAFGLSPALHATRAGVAGALRDSGGGTRSRSRLQRGFVVAQIALSQPLLVLLGTMLSLVIADYQPLAREMSRHVISAAFHPLTKTGGPRQRPEAVDSLIPRIAARPEVASAVPEPTAFAIRAVVAPDRPGRNGPAIVHLEGAAPGWFNLVEVPIVLGRDVSLADTAATDRPIVIGSDLARALWGEANPIGRTLASPAVRGLSDDSISMRVVGVYDAASRLPGMTFNGYAARGDAPKRVFTAHGKHWQHDRILVRTRGAAEPFLPELRRFVRTQVPALPVSSISTLAQIDAREYRESLRDAAFAGAGGLLAMLLASLGLYGVVSLAVQQRTREIGIRIAVGAEPARVARMFLASGVRVSLAALLIGLPLSIAGLRIGMSQGIVIAPHVNPYVVGASIAMVLVAVAAAATWAPARRASRVDPATTLRVE